MDQFGGYLARKQTHIHKLAMVLSASQCDDLVITKDVLEASDSFVSSLERDMPLIYQRIGQTEITRGSSQILEIVARAQAIERSELYKKLFRTMSYRDFELALMGAIQAGHITQTQVGNDFMIRSKV
jgi:hypothetical protein